ncbi:MAG: UDP-N-acetylmuramoyl-L-alanine--D-glutamate ligase [Pseudomonadales bacterium]|nr:UDP-N-acetylmuramoyl-L-alanine--D-glutamate ligase [Pseudomonadales bacterium]
MIVGLGKTGLSCAKYLSRKGEAWAVQDSQTAPVLLSALRELNPAASFGPLDETALLQAQEIILSPGVPASLPEIQRAISAGVPVTGDVAMFLSLAAEPVVGITGSNGKSTVTSLVGEILSAAGRNPGVGGNLGTPCLDLLDDAHGCYVIEMSSYQLERVTQAGCHLAVVLNLSPDHLDRYDSLDQYYAAKARIYSGAKTALLNRELSTQFRFDSATRVVSFGSDEPQDAASYGLRNIDGQIFLAHGADNLLATRDLGIKGSHNYSNALVALAIADIMEVPRDITLTILRSYAGLPHRCEWLGAVDGVFYVNDSKSTNPESTRAAVSGFSEFRRIHLLLGGQGKGADFRLLNEVVGQHVTSVVLYGKDAEVIHSQLSGSTPCEITDTLASALSLIRERSQTGDLVLFSPACASLDQFRNFEHRGDYFRQLVQERAK